MELIEKVIIHCRMRDSGPKLMCLLKELGVNHYFAFCELKNESFIAKCESFLERKNIGAKPGEIIMLRKIGEIVSKMTEDEFGIEFLGDSEDEKDEIGTKRNFPLLSELNKQQNKKDYSQTLKDVSVLIRLQAGRSVHKFLSDNLPIPKTSATDKYLKQFDYVQEGELQVRIQTIISL